MSKKNSELLYGAHLAIKRLEWIERHVLAKGDAGDVLADEIDNLRAYLEGLLKAFEPPIR